MRPPILKLLFITGSCPVSYHVEVGEQRPKDGRHQGFVVLGGAEEHQRLHKDPCRRRLRSFSTCVHTPRILKHPHLLGSTLSPRSKSTPKGLARCQEHPVNRQKMSSSFLKILSCVDTFPLYFYCNCAFYQTARYGHWVA